MEQGGPLLLPSLPVELWESIIDWVIRLQLHPWSLEKPINEGLRALLALESTCKGFRSFVLVSFPRLLTAFRSLANTSFNFLSLTILIDAESRTVGGNSDQAIHRGMPRRSRCSQGVRRSSLRSVKKAIHEEALPLPSSTSAGIGLRSS